MASASDRSGLDRLGPLAYGAEEALARRDKDFFALQTRRPLELAWQVGVTGVGLFVLDWNPASLWVFLILTQWGHIARNALKVTTAGEATRRFYQGVQHDARFWNAVSAVRKNRDPSKLTPPPETHWSPTGLVVLDVLLLSIATALILGAAAQRDVYLLASIAADRSLLIVVAITLLWQIVPPVFTDRGTDATGAAIMTCDSGGAGVIGWILMFLFMALVQGESSVRLSIIVINALLLIGVPIAILARKAYIDETRWVREQLAAEAASRPG